MPGLVKIGMTTRKPSTRMRELSAATGVPTPFQLHHYVSTDDCAAAEQTVHRLLSRHRVNRYREFFKVTPERASQVIEKVADGRMRYRPMSVFLRLVLSLAVGAGFWAFFHSGLVALPFHSLGRWGPEMLASAAAVMFHLATRPHHPRHRKVKRRRRR